MIKKPQVEMLVCLLVVFASPCLFSQSATIPGAGPCKVVHRVIVPKNPARSSDGDILPGQSITQARITVGENATVRVVEHPRSGRDLDSFNSTITIQKGQTVQQYLLKNLIKGGEFFRLVETAKLCSSPSTGTVFLAFEAGSTGVSEAFAAVRYSSLSVAVKALPVANEGRIVIFSPTRLELWTAGEGEGLGGIESDAGKKRYAVETCELGQEQQERVQCSSQTRTGGVVSPDEFMRARIKIH